MQGEIGNCWFLSAAASMAEIPERLENVFINEDDTATNGISKNGIYALRMYALMEPIILTIDDKLPLRKSNDQTIYSFIGKDHSVWAPLLEKAFARYHGTYEATIGGNPLVALNTLAGAPGEMIKHNKLSNEAAENELWERLVALPESTMIQAGSKRL